MYYGYCKYLHDLMGNLGPAVAASAIFNHVSNKRTIRSLQDYAVNHGIIYG